MSPSTLFPSPGCSLEPGALLPGRDGDDRYVLRSLIACGGFGQVWSALDRRLKRDIAVKIIHQKLPGEHIDPAQFEIEAITTGQLEHPGIVPVYDVGYTAEGQLFYCMKLVGGRSFRDELNDLRQLPEGHAREEKRRRLYGRFVDVCNTIAFANVRGVLHLDLKPDNVFLGEFGEVQVLDWGLAYRPSEPAATNGSPPVASAYGTPRYMSPEQIAGSLSEFGPASDVYALGVFLSEIALAELGETLPATTVLLPLAPASMRRSTQAFPGPVRAICLKALAERPCDRYQDTRDLGLEVERFLAGERVLAHREPLWTKAKRQARKHRPLAAAALVGLVLIAAWAGDRLQRWATGRAFAQSAHAGAVKDWRSGRMQDAIGRLQAAADRLQSDGASAAALEVTTGQLQDWRRFDELLDRGRFLSVDPDRRKEARQSCVMALLLADVGVPEEFRSEALSQQREAARVELRQLLARLNSADSTVDLPKGDGAYPGDWYLLGRDHHLADRHTEAAVAYQRLLAKQPDHFWAMFFLANCHERLGRLEQAALGYTACLARRGDLAFLFLARGNAYFQAERYEQAAEDYDRADTLAGGDARVRHNRATLRLRQGDRLAARRDLNAALALDPGFAPSLALRASLAREMGDLEAAFADLNRLLRQGRSAAPLANRALGAYELGDMSSAEQDATEALALDPDEPTALSVLGLIHAARREWPKAIDAYRKAIVSDPDRVAHRNNLAEALMVRQRFAEAKQELDAALDLQPDYSIGRLNRAMVAVGLGRAEAALADLEQLPIPVPHASGAGLVEHFRRIALNASATFSAERARPIVALCQAHIDALSPPSK